MDTSCKLKLLVKREDTGKSVRLEVENDQQLFDILDLIKVRLEFEENANLCFCQDGQEVDEAVDLAELNCKKVLLVEDKRMEERVVMNEKNGESKITSNKLKYVVKREDTGKVIRVDVEEDKQVLDVLELSKVPLKFARDARLCVYQDGKEICEAVHLSDVSPKKVLLVKDKGIEKKEAENKENMATATKLHDSISEKVRKADNAKSSPEAFREHFAKQDPSLSQADKEHKLLDDLKKQTRGNAAAVGSPRDVTEDEEIRILTRKMNIEGPDGFEYEIIPESYTDLNKSSHCSHSFSSEEERRATQSKVTCTTDWSSWEAKFGFSAWGIVSVNATAGGDASDSKHDGSKTENTTKTCVAVVTKTSYHQMKKFRVKVKLSEKAIQDARQVLNTPMPEKYRSINKFNEKYCSLVYSGKFSAGGWFRTIATATSRKAMDFTALKEEATRRTEKHWSVGVSGHGAAPGGTLGANAGGAQSEGISQERNNQKREESCTSSVQVSFSLESVPGNTSDDNDLENKIKDPKSWTVFPFVGAMKSHFTPIYDIMKSQAQATGDEDLERVALIMKLDIKNRSVVKENFQSPPYVVFLGAVGTGKSTVVEKVTGQKGRSSDAYESCTRTSEVFWVPDGSLIVSDTPGSNPLEDKLQHNVWIAGALNFMPVSKVFIVVKAETRIASVVDRVRKYVDWFLELPEELLAVLVTHMDMVGWTKNDFTPKVNRELGIDTVVFSWLNTKSETLVHDILQTCTKRPYSLTVNDENFFKLFHVHNNHRTILQYTADEVKKFREKKRQFDEVRKSFCGTYEELVDLVFTFLAEMTQEIVEAQMRMPEEFGFTFDGDNGANEAGHVVNMVNQLLAVLHDVKQECADYLRIYRASMRHNRPCCKCDLAARRDDTCFRCEVCGFESSLYFKKSLALAVLSALFWTLRIIILLVGIRGTLGGKAWFLEILVNGLGCGTLMLSKHMRRSVDIPSEFQVDAVRARDTSDIQILPETASRFRKQLNDKIDAAQKEMKLSL